MTSAKTVKGWRVVVPKLVSERRALYARCGADAFLDPKGLKFPIMSKRGPGCRVDCRGLRAAKARATQYRKTDIAAKADRIGRAARCRWA